MPGARNPSPHTRPGASTVPSGPRGLCRGEQTWTIHCRGKGRHSYYSNSVGWDFYNYLEGRSFLLIALKGIEFHSQMSRVTTFPSHLSYERIAVT